MTLTSWSSSRQVQHIVSQSALIKFVHEKDMHRGHLKEMGNKTIGQIGLGSGGVVSSPMHDSVVSPSFRLPAALDSGG